MDKERALELAERMKRQEAVEREAEAQAELARERSRPGQKRDLEEVLSHELQRGEVNRLRVEEDVKPVHITPVGFV
jgi:hypothetical protein